MPKYEWDGKQRLSMCLRLDPSVLGLGLSLIVTTQRLRAITSARRLTFLTSVS